MPEDVDGLERCATCGADASGTKAYCHFYTNGSRTVYCSPACAELSLRGVRAEKVAAAPPGDFFDDLVREMRWANWG